MDSFVTGDHSFNRDWVRAVSHPTASVFTHQVFWLAVLVKADVQDANLCVIVRPLAAPGHTLRRQFPFLENNDV